MVECEIIPEATPHSLKPDINNQLGVASESLFM